MIIISQWREYECRKNTMVRKKKSIQKKLPALPSKTDLKLHNICVTPHLVKKVVMTLDLSKTSGPDCIPVVVLKNCDPELSYILAKLFKMCLKETSFPDCCNVSSVLPVFIKNARERSMAKNYQPVALLFLISKVLEKLVNNRFVVGNVAFRLNFSTISGVLDQLQIF